RFAGFQEPGRQAVDIRADGDAELADEDQAGGLAGGAEHGHHEHGVALPAGGGRGPARGEDPAAGMAPGLPEGGGEVEPALVGEFFDPGNMHGQMASGPRSPVRMRMQSSRGRMKILPSPMRPSGPVRPASRMAWTVGSTKSSLTAICSCTLRSRLTVS